MLRRFLIASLVFQLTSAVITDLNCTNADGKYGKTAFNCDNRQNDAFCTAVFGGNPAIAENTDTERPNPCWKDATALNENVKQGAIGACAKTCGYCCQTPEFTCADKDFPRITCSSVTQEMCKDMKWREIIAQDCPSKCGFCLEGGCVDAAIECAKDKSICRNVDAQDFVRTNCKKTCGYCENISTLPGGSTTPSYSGNCGDSHSNCKTWVKNGFCSSAFYTANSKREYCGKSCGMC